MNIRQLYQNRERIEHFFGRQFQKSADQVIAELYSDNVQVMPQDGAPVSLESLLGGRSQYSLKARLGGPVAVRDELLKDLIAFNYIFALFTDGRTHILGEIGGLMPLYDGVLTVVADGDALSDFHYSAEQLRDDPAAVEELEQELLSSPVEFDENNVRLDIAKHAMHYDFTTRFGRDMPELLDMRKAGTYMLLASQGFVFRVSKQVPGEHYIFNIPENPDVFGEMVGMKPTDSREAAEYLAERQSELIPPDYIAGFRVVCRDGIAEARPMIPESQLRSHNTFFHSMEFEPSLSSLAYLGVLFDGNQVTIYHDGIL